jgi:predicted ribonuclease YlaK
LEATALVGRLEAIVGRLRGEQKLFELPADCVAVLPDTSVWLHCRWYQDIDWPKEAHAKGVRLVVPDLVLDELDSKSYASLSTGPRAKRTMRSLLSLHKAGEPPEMPVEVPKRQGVMLQFLVDKENHERLANRDGEILRRAEELMNIVGSDHLLIASRDGGQIVRARSRGLRSLWLEDEKAADGAAARSNA